MKLQFLLEGIDLPEKTQLPADLTVEGICLDSRELKQNDLFIALEGDQCHGIDFATKALEVGAAAILTDKMPAIHVEMPIIFIPNLRTNLQKLAARMWPLARHVKVLGVTGTNGKTSIVWMLSKAFERLGKPSARLGTLGATFGRASMSTNLTTADIFQNYQFLDTVASKEGHYAAMEISSHALTQNRCEGLTIDTAIFTNLTLDHLDYHETMEAYADAKAKLFSTDGLRWAILSHASPYTKIMKASMSPTAQCITYGIDTPEADVVATNIQYSLSTTTGWVDSPWGSGFLRTSHIGHAGLENALAMIASLCTHAVPFFKALAVCEGIPPVPGRLECKILSNGVTACIDYSHTPDALENALKTLKHVQKEGRILCVFGCGGDRDKSKRPLMGQVAEAGADECFITNDNPRNESGQDIADQIAAGMKNIPTVILDRKEAIISAIRSAKPGDIVLIAGKGHEKTQLIKGTHYPLDDREVVRTLEEQLDAVV